MKYVCKSMCFVLWIVNALLAELCTAYIPCWFITNCEKITMRQFDSILCEGGVNTQGSQVYNIEYFRTCNFLELDSVSFLIWNYLESGLSSELRLPRLTAFSNGQKGGKWFCLFSLTSHWMISIAGKYCLKIWEIHTSHPAIFSLSIWSRNRNNVLELIYIASLCLLSTS